jgi:NAD(P)-dependent dehydrogenase (short-subunit alcohol dehydrogenase family)
MGKLFGATSTTDEVLDGVDLDGKRIFITGVSAGLGVETARALTAGGAEVVGSVRDLDKGRRAMAAAGQSWDLVEADLESLASVRACADGLNKDGRKFDLVVANAGVMATPFSRTKDGFERQIGTNHISHFVLVNRIAPLIASGGRLVTLSSAGHRISDVDLDDPNFERTTYTPFQAYGRSKTANILFAVEFDRRQRDRDVRATAVHPGAIVTELGRYMTKEATDEMAANRARANRGAALNLKSVPQGAATTVWAGVVADKTAVGGRYCEDCQVAEPDDGPTAFAGIRSYALDGERAKALWARSEEWVGERF